MNRIVAMFVVLTLSLASLTCGGGEEAAQSAQELATPEEKLSYALGMEIGASLGRLGTEIDISAFSHGVEDVLLGHAPFLTPAEADELRTAFARRMQEQLEQKMKAIAEGNLAQSRQFFQENGRKEGVITTQSGLQYVVVEEGDGPQPGPTDTVEVHYRGRLLDRTEFDSSHARGEAARFPLTTVVPGWSEGVQLMRVGGKYRLFIPPDLAYGELGRPPRIEPNLALVFDVELLGVEEGQEGPAETPGETLPGDEPQETPG